MNRLSQILVSLTLLLVSCKHEVYYTVTTNVQPADGGIVTMSSSSSSVLEGTAVTFTAQPKGDYIFTGWSGGLSGTENPKSVSITSDMAVTANFSLREYPLVITVEGEGSVSERVLPTKSDYASGTVVELTANPSQYWVFDHWEGDLGGNENPAQIALLSPKTIKAVFKYDLDRHKGSFSPITAKDFVASIKLGSNLAAILDGYDFSHQEGYDDDYYSTSDGKPKVQYYNEYNGKMSPEIAKAMLDALKDVGVNAIASPSLLPRI